MFVLCKPLFGIFASECYTRVISSDLEFKFTNFSSIVPILLSSLGLWFLLEVFSLEAYCFFFFFFETLWSIFGLFSFYLLSGSSFIYSFKALTDRKDLWLSQGCSYNWHFLLTVGYYTSLLRYCLLTCLVKFFSLGAYVPWSFTCGNSCRLCFKVFLQRGFGFALYVVLKTLPIH